MSDAESTAGSSEVAARRFRLASPKVATALAVLLVLLGAASVLLDGFNHQLSASRDGGRLAVLLVYAVVGAVVARRQPRNPVGWLLLMAIFLFVLSS